MNVRDSLLPLAALLVAATGVSAQEHRHQPTNPYAELEREPPVALAAEDVDGLRAGLGLGYALAAELNGVPGPRHVLELAEPLGLDAETRAAVTAIRDRMAEEARRLGEELIDAELRLDDFFASGGTDPEALVRLVSEAAVIEGRLRAAHLGAHLEVAERLTPEQIARYAMLRGYAEHGSGQPAG